MDLITRAGWAARPWRQPNGSIAYSVPRKGVKIHYLGTAYSSRAHTQCAGYVRQTQSQHMDGNGWSDVGYSFLVCEHGSVYEGRGLQRRNSANGGTALNEAHYAVCALLGSSGLTVPPDTQLNGLRDAIGHCRSKGPAGSEIKGHRDGYATTCPGPELYAWVQRGAPRPATATEPVKEPDMALTADDKKWIRDLINASRAQTVREVWVKDGIIRNPGPNAETNPYIAGGTGLRNIEIIARRLEAAGKTRDVVLVQMVEALAARDEAVDVDALLGRISERIAAEVSRVTVEVRLTDEPDAAP